MRVWDVSPQQLCHVHLLGEHRALCNLDDLNNRQKRIYQSPRNMEMGWIICCYLQMAQRRGSEKEEKNYKHASDLDQGLATGKKIQDVLVSTLSKQRELLKNKNCECYTFVLWKV